MSTQPPPQPDSTGDQIHATVGEGARSVTVGKNIIQIGTLVLPFWLATLLAVAALVLVGTVGLVLYHNTPITTSAVPTTTPIATAAPDETLIIIVPFHHTGLNVDAHQRVKDALDRERKNFPELRLLIVVDDKLELKADQRAEAKALAERYNASMVIWGEDTVTQMKVNLLNLRAVAFADAAPVVVEQEDVQFNQFVKPDGYTRFINEGLPNQMTFLALVAIAEAQLLAPDSETQRQAGETLHSAINLIPPEETFVGEADAYFTLGWITHYYQMDLTAAIDAFTHVVLLEPANADAHFNLAEIYDLQGDYEKALDHFTESIEAAPRTNAWAYDGRANLYTFHEEYQKAFEDYTTFIQMQPDNPVGYMNRSDVAGWLDDWATALADYNRVFELVPEQAHHYVTRAYIHRQRGDWQAAVADLERAMALSDPIPAKQYYDRGEAYMAGAQWVAALTDFTSVLQANPDDRFAYLARARVYIQLADNDAALADLNQALTIPGRRELYDAYFERGRLYHHLGKQSQARADLQTYLDGQPAGEFATEAKTLLKEIEQES